jgi:TPR repeat protein
MRSTVFGTVLAVVGVMPTLCAQSKDGAEFQRNIQWAQDGQVAAELAVGEDYMRARVVRRSYPAAHEWLQRASDAGSADARAMLGKMKVNGWGEAPDVQGGLGLVRQAAVAGSTAAKAYLGSLYESGAKVGGKDPQMAMQLYREGIAAGDTYCMALLGNMYLAGDGIEKDSAASRQFLEKSALWGDEWGEAFLGDAILHGSYGRPDLVRAIALFQASAKTGNYEALFKLGSLYEEGTGVTKDLDLALRYYRRAANLDFAPAENALAAMYDLGVGLNVNKPVAYFWSSLAAAQGNKLASARLKLLEIQLSPAELAEAQQHLNAFRTAGLSKPSPRP